MEVSPRRGFARAMTYLTQRSSVSSPRSGRQHKAWGVSPRIKERKWMEPAKRAIAVAVDAIQIIRLPPAPRAWFNLPARSWGSRPRLYADVRSADSDDQTRPLNRKILPKAYSAESSMLLPSQSLALGLTLTAAPQLVNLSPLPFSATVS